MRANLEADHLVSVFPDEVRSFRMKFRSREITMFYQNSPSTETERETCLHHLIWGFNTSTSGRERYMLDHIGPRLSRIFIHRRETCVNRTMRWKLLVEGLNGLRAVAKSKIGMSVWSIFREFP